MPSSDSISLSLRAGLGLFAIRAFSLFVGIPGSTPWSFPRSSTAPSRIALRSSSLLICSCSSAACDLSASTSSAMSFGAASILQGASSPRSWFFHLQRTALVTPTASATSCADAFLDASAMTASRFWSSVNEPALARLLRLPGSSSSTQLASSSLDFGYPSWRTVRARHCPRSKKWSTAALFWRSSQRRWRPRLKSPFSASSMCHSLRVWRLGYPSSFMTAAALRSYLR